MPIPSRTCRHCAVDFIPKRTDRVAYCSRECAFEARRACIPVKQRKPVACVQCGSPIARGLRCSECLKVQARELSRRHSMLKHDSSPRSCQECGLMFSPTYGVKLRAYCSEACGRRSSKRAARLVGKARKRAATVEPVNPTRVFERDGWKCHLCGGLTARERRGTYHPKAPELDHIVPLSKGGEHSYRNTACAHRKCNADKSDTVMGQPSLLAA